MAENRGLVLIVEDERSISDIQRLYFTQAGFSVHVQSDGRLGLAEVARLRPVAIVLDIGLPGIDGLEFTRTLRERRDWTPIIVVTARDDEVDRILGIELGADDYLTKPFSPRELVARVRGLLRRSAAYTAQAQLTVGTVTLDPLRHVVQVNGTAVELTATEFELLAELMAQPGRVFSREQLLSSVWGVADYSASRTVDVHIAQVRAKLGESSPIRTIRGIGYAAGSS